MTMDSEFLKGYEEAISAIGARLSAFEELPRYALPPTAIFDHFGGKGAFTRPWGLDRIAGGTATAIASTTTAGSIDYADGVSTPSNWARNAPEWYAGGAITICVAWSGSTNPGGNNTIFVRRDLNELKTGGALTNLTSNQDSITVPATGTDITVSRFNVTTRPDPSDLLNTAWSLGMQRNGASGAPDDSYTGTWRVHAVWLEATDPGLASWWATALTGRNAQVSIPNDVQPTLVRLSTGATANSVASLEWAGHANLGGMAQYVRSIARLRLPTWPYDAVGGANLFLTNDTSFTDFLALGWSGPDDGSRFVARARTGGTTTTVITEVAIDTEWHEYEIRTFPHSVWFFLDGEFLCEISTDIPASAALEPCLRVFNGATAADRRFEADWIGVHELAA